MSCDHLTLIRRLMVAIARFCRDEIRNDGTQGGFDPEEESIPAEIEEVIKALPLFSSVRLASRAREKGFRAIISYSTPSTNSKTARLVVCWPGCPIVCRLKSG